jgi:hypothetical protein
MRVTRDPLEGQSLRVLGRPRRHGAEERLVVLPGGSRRMIPQAWTDQEPAAGGMGQAWLRPSGMAPDSLVRWWPTHTA